MISSTLANTHLAVWRLLKNLNIILGTSYTLHTLHSWGLHLEMLWLWHYVHLLSPLVLVQRLDLCGRWFIRAQSAGLKDAARCTRRRHNCFGEYYMRGWTKKIARVCAHLACADPYRHGLGSNRIEMLNLKRSMRGWVCLQKEGIREELRVEEWKLEVLTMRQDVLVEDRIIHQGHPPDSTPSNCTRFLARPFGYCG